MLIFKQLDTNCRVPFISFSALEKEHLGVSEHSLDLCHGNLDRLRFHTLNSNDNGATPTTSFI